MKAVLRRRGYHILKEVNRIEINSWGCLLFKVGKYLARPRHPCVIATKQWIEERRREDRAKLPNLIITFSDSNSKKLVEMR